MAASWKQGMNKWVYTYKNLLKTMHKVAIDCKTCEIGVYNKNPQKIG